MHILFPVPLQAVPGLRWLRVPGKTVQLTGEKASTIMSAAMYVKGRMKENINEIPVSVVHLCNSNSQIASRFSQG